MVKVSNGNGRMVRCTIITLRTQRTLASTVVMIGNECGFLSYGYGPVNRAQEG